MTKKPGQSTLHYIIVLIVFAVTGSTAAIISKWLMPITGIPKGTIGYIVVYILLITPIYQVLLLGYAWIFGKYSYFLDKQKKLFNRIIGRKKKNPPMPPPREEKTPKTS